MKDSVLNNLMQRRTEPPSPDTDEMVADDLGSFGWLRGVRDRSIMLELRFKNGNIRAFGYAWLERVEYNPSDGIVLHFIGQKIKIVGRNLNRVLRSNIRLFDGLLRHRVSWIQEADEPTILGAAKDATVIEKVEFMT